MKPYQVNLRDANTQLDAACEAVNKAYSGYRDEVQKLTLDQLIESFDYVFTASFNRCSTPSSLLIDGDSFYIPLISKNGTASFRFSLSLTMRYTCVIEEDGDSVWDSSGKVTTLSEVNAVSQSVVEALNRFKRGDLETVYSTTFPDAPEETGFILRSFKDGEICFYTSDAQYSQVCTLIVEEYAGVWQASETKYTTDSFRVFGNDLVQVMNKIAPSDNIDLGEWVANEYRFRKNDKFSV